MLTSFRVACLPQSDTSQCSYNYVDRSAARFICKAALTTFPLVMIPTSLPSASTTGNRRYFVSSNNLAASSKFEVSRTTSGAGVIRSPTTLPFVLLSRFCISLNVCHHVQQKYTIIIFFHMIKKWCCNHQSTVIMQLFFLQIILLNQGTSMAELISVPSFYKILLQQEMLMLELIQWLHSHLYFEGSPQNHVHLQ